MLNKTTLLEELKNAIENYNVGVLTLRIEGVYKYPEITQNPLGNFEFIAKQIEHAYNEDLTRKTNSGIKITDYHIRGGWVD